MTLLLDVKEAAPGIADLAPSHSSTNSLMNTHLSLLLPWPQLSSKIRVLKSPSISESVKKKIHKTWKLEMPVLL